MRRHLLMGPVAGLPMMSECLRCPGCGQLAIEASRPRRMLSMAALLPSLLVLFVALSTGVQFVTQFGRVGFSIDLAALGLFLTVACGLIAHRYARTWWQMLRGRHLTALRQEG